MIVVCCILVSVPFSHNASRERVKQRTNCLFRVDLTLPKTTSGMHSMSLFYEHKPNKTNWYTEVKYRCVFFFKLAGQTKVNPLTPVPPVTARDEPWPFFHFWRHHLWPNLASSILNFCRRKRSFQWCLVHSDWLIGTSNMPKNAQKVERKTRSQISCHYT